MEWITSHFSILGGFAESIPAQTAAGGYPTHSFPQNDRGYSITTLNSMGSGVSKRIRTCSSSQVHSEAMERLPLEGQRGGKEEPLIALILSTSYFPDWKSQVNIAPGLVLPIAVHGLHLHLDAVVWARLAEGMAGVYEVRFRVPTDVPGGTLACGSEVYHTLIRNNLTVNIGYSPSVSAPLYDGAGICVAVPADRAPANRQRGSR